MPVIGNTVATLADWAKRLDPDGKVPATVELLGQTNEILDDQLWAQGNLPTGHRINQRTGLPSVYWRLLNKGTPTSKSTTASVDEHCGMLTARSNVDKDLAELNGNTNDFRLSEAQAFLEAMSQESASTLFYGSAANPEEFVGLAPRYSSLSAGNAGNIIAGGGAGADNTSIWLIGWGEQSIQGIFPKGSKAGLSHEDLGLDDVKDADGHEYRAYKDLFEWKQGIALKDWRYVVRIPNIDISATVADSDGSSVNLQELMIKALHRLPSMANVRPAFYVNRTIRQMLDIQAMNKTNLQLQVGEEEGRLKTMLRGVPIRTCDALLETETLVA